MFLFYSHLEDVAKDMSHVIPHFWNLNSSPERQMINPRVHPIEYLLEKAPESLQSPVN